MVFADRKDAGERLAQEVRARGYERPLVLALPRGGVPVAYEVARTLKCPLDTIVSRKIGAPLNPEWAVGSLAPGDTAIIDEDALRTARISRLAVEGVVAKEKRELERRMSTYKSGTYSVGCVPSTVIIVDDGVATGLTAKATLISARKKYPKARLVFAAPICIPGSQGVFGPLTDDVICLTGPGVSAVGEAYDDFTQVTDAEVVQYLSRERN